MVSWVLGSVFAGVPAGQASTRANSFLSGYLDALVGSLGECERLEANHGAFEGLGGIGKSFCSILLA